MGQKSHIKNFYTLALNKLTHSKKPNSFSKRTHPNRALKYILSKVYYGSFMSQGLSFKIVLQGLINTQIDLVWSLSNINLACSQCKSRCWCVLVVAPFVRRRSIQKGLACWRSHTFWQKMKLSGSIDPTF